MKIFPVVHINSSLETAVHESNRAFELGADGIYLINHHSAGNNTEPLFNVFNMVMAESTDRYVGLNLLGLSPRSAMHALAKALGEDNGLILPPMGLWVDNMHDDEFPKSAIEFRDSQQELRHVRLLGGIAFKYTSTYTEDPGKAQYEVELLKDSVDVITTSGAATGQPPTIEKLFAMKEVAEGKLLAVASGISAENIGQYAGFVDEVLVSTSVETSRYSGVFDQDKLKRLIEIAHSLAK